MQLQALQRGGGNKVVKAIRHSGPWFSWQPPKQHYSTLTPSAGLQPLCVWHGGTCHEVELGEEKTHFLKLHGELIFQTTRVKLLNSTDMLLNIIIILQTNVLTQYVYNVAYRIHWVRVRPYSLHKYRLVESSIGYRWGVDRVKMIYCINRIGHDKCVSLDIKEKERIWSWLLKALHLPVLCCPSVSHLLYCIRAHDLEASWHSLSFSIRFRKNKCVPVTLYYRADHKGSLADTVNQLGDCSVCV